MCPPESRGRGTSLAVDRIGLVIANKARPIQEIATCSFNILIRWNGAYAVKSDLKGKFWLCKPLINPPYL